MHDHDENADRLLATACATFCACFITTWVLLETGRRNAPAPATLSLAPEKDCRRVPKAVADR
uniref:Uncharacterized protein n=1 Tax=Arundo donax TaxID=35708 RepID=A0A0A9GHC2_ARUDO